MILLSYCENVLQKLKSLLGSVDFELEAMPEGRIHQTSSSHTVKSAKPGDGLSENNVNYDRGKKSEFRVNYRVVTGHGEGRRRKLIPDSMVENLLPVYLHKEYLKAKKKLIKNNITALETFIASYQAITMENIRAMIPGRFQHFADELFLPPSANDDWASQPYEKATYNSSALRHMTSKGLLVRSKSEVLIAELLYALGLPFHYEEVLYINGATYIPDFTILAPDGSIWYLEHCGMTNDPEYLHRHFKKMEAYAAAGIAPWKNLIVTYDNEHGDIDLMAIKKEIESRILS
ncbi:MAG: hypothetical protein IJC14_06115 [Firmicutes bacterium]|nr:hypothetical protein [Bacillota bacterium]